MKQYILKRNSVKNFSPMLEACHIDYLIKTPGSGIFPEYMFSYEAFAPGRKTATKFTAAEAIQERSKFPDFVIIEEKEET